MEYIFGYEKKYGTTVKVKDPENATLPLGQAIVERPYADQIITDSFYVKQLIREDTDSEGNHYAWYQISDHWQSRDKFTPGIVATEQEITDYDLAMIEAEQEITDLDLRLMELELKEE